MGKYIAQEKYMGKYLAVEKYIAIGKHLAMGKYGSVQVLLQQVFPSLRPPPP